MQIEIVTTVARFAELGPQWDQALTENELESTWMSHAWLNCWWRAFGSGGKLLVPVLWNADQITLAVPLMLEKRALKGVSVKALGFIQNGLTPRSSLIGTKPSSAAVVKLLEELCRRDRLWRVAVLENLIEDSQANELIQAAARELGLGLLQEPARISPFIELPDGYDSWFSSLGRDMRRNIRRARTRLAELGKLEAVCCDSSENWQEDLESCFTISARSWKGPTGKNLGGRADRRQFITEFTEEAAKRGWASIWLLKLDGKAIAFELHLRRGDVVLPLAADFDQEYREHSPGVALRSHILEELAAAGVTRYDFGGTVYGYKMQWTKLTQPHVNLWLFNRRPLSRLLGWTKKRLLNRESKVAKG